MAKTQKLLLVENVDNLGIVGDVVSVRTGYARNYLLPRELATTPSEELVKQLAGKRAEAERQLAEQRKNRETMIQKIKGIEITLVRSVNDQGILYGAITQQDVASALSSQGYMVKPREVRLPQTIKRVGAFEVQVKLDTDLDASIKLTVNPDRELELEKEGESTAAAAGESHLNDFEKAVADDAKKGKATGWGSGSSESSDKSDKGDKADKKAKKAEAAEAGDKAEKKAKKPKA